MLTDHPLGVAPAGVGTEVDIPGRVERRQPGVEAQAGLDRQVLEIRP